MLEFRLKGLRVRGYKALKDFALDEIPPLTVVVGPNGSGKSSLFEVVTLVGELARGPLPMFDIDSYLSHQFRFNRSLTGFSGVVHPQVGFVEIVLDIQEHNHLYTYQLRLQRAGNRAVMGIECDTAVEILTRDDGQELLHYTGDHDSQAVSPSSLPKRYHAVVNGKNERILWTHAHPLLLLNAPNDKLAEDKLFLGLRDFFKGWQGFKAVFTYLLAKGWQNTEANLMTPGEHFPGERLDLPMGNSPQVLLRLKEQQPEVFEDIREIFRVAAGLDEKYTVEVEKSGRILIYLKDLSSAKWYDKYWLADWPDGWKAFLSWLVALRTAPPGAVIYLEEPENNLHPRLLAQMLEQIDKANERGIQVFISTHSMELVNLVTPSELVLMDSGCAYRLDPERADKIREAGILLGSAWASGFLDAAKQQ